MIVRVLTAAVFTLFCAFLALAQTPKTVNGGVLNGKAVSLPKPAYPEAARAAKVQGAVAVNIEIDEAGNVVAAEADIYDPTERRSADGMRMEPQLSDPVLRQAAEEAARQAKFAPTLLDGQPIRVKGRVVYNFIAESSSGESLDAKKMSSISGGVLNGKAGSLPAPAYPPAAMAVRADGAVNVQVLIDEAGNVISAAAVSGHPLLRAAAEAAAREAKFAPTRLSGQEVKVSGVVTYNFVLPKREEP